MSNYLTREQIDQLLKPIHPSRVSVREGMSHLEAYDVRAHLDRIFGFCRWSADVVELVQIFEQVGTKKSGDREWEIVSVGYRATLRLAVMSSNGTFLASYTEAAAGDAVNFPINKRADAHDFAMKTAESQALKRCVTNLGDQFGLSLYQKGSRDALVKRTLVLPDGNPSSDDTAVDDHVLPVVPETAEEEHTPAPHDANRVQATSAQSTAATTPAAVSPPPPAPSSPEEQGEAQAQEQAAHLRDEALAIRDAAQAGGKVRDAIADLGKLGLRASKAKLQNQLVRRESGEEVKFSAFISELITQCQRSAA